MVKKAKRKSKSKKELKELILNKFCSNLSLLRMSGYVVTVMFPGDAGWERPAHDSFAVRVHFPYKAIDLFVGKDVVNNPEDSCDLELMHEAVHVMLWRYSTLAESRFVTNKQLGDEDEHITDHITNIIMGLTK